MDSHYRYAQLSMINKNSRTRHFYKPLLKEFAILVYS